MFDKIKEDVREAVTGATVEDDLRARLHADHDEVARLLGELEATTEADHDQRSDLRDELHRGLAAHATAEEEVVYRRLQSDARLADKLQHAFREHGEMDAALQAVIALDPSDPAFGEAVKELKQLVTHHVHEEEGDLLPKAEQTLGKNELAALIPAFNIRKRQLVGQIEGEQKLRTATTFDEA